MPPFVSKINRDWLTISFSKAATTLFERYWDTTYKDLRKNLSGIVLFGTPHTTQQHQERWSSLTFLLRSYYELSGQSLYQAELEGATVAKLSERFEEFVQNTPVISVYETKKTKMVKSLFGSKERLVRLEAILLALAY